MAIWVSAPKELPYEEVAAVNVAIEQLEWTQP